MAYNIYENRMDTEPLRQGDILNTHMLRENLRGHQDYFAEQQHFNYYMVLTQSCDLARGGVDFIFLSTVRVFREAIKFNQVQSRTAKDANRNFIRDLYLHSYNKRGFFYLPCDSRKGLVEDHIVDLRVMFSLHKLHYPDLIQARLCGITDLYAAQLGHIAGHMFNRVATPDWEEIYDGEDNISPSDKAKKTLDELGDQYRQRCEELISEKGNICTIEGCSSKAEDFRWLPIRWQDGKTRFKERLLCKKHIQNWDRDRIL